MLDIIEYYFGYFKRSNEPQVELISLLNKLIVDGPASSNLLFFSTADKIIRDTNNSIDIRYTALLKVGEVMKVPPQADEDPESAVAEYIDLVMA